MKRTTVEETILKTRIMVTDGAMSTALERLGCDLRDSLWTAKVLAQQPEMIKQVHMDYLRAGADCGITASYQATIPGLMARGYSEQEAEDLIARSVSAFLEARDEWWEAEGRDSGRAWPLCLGSAGPYGAYLADGSEYRGNYGISRKELREFHLRRAEILWEAGSDLLLFETLPSLKEAVVEAEIAEEMGADYWISFTCRDERSIPEGDLLRDCASELIGERYPHLRMIGVNCTAPELIESLIHELKFSTEPRLPSIPTAERSTTRGSKNGTACPVRYPSGNML